MFYLLTIVTAFLIVTGQALWKAGVESSHLTPSLKTLFSTKFLHLLLSPYVIGGAAIYGFATVLYILTLTKYQYSTSQSVVVSLSLIFTFIAAKFLFSERISSINIVGLLFLVGGIVLVTRR